MSDPTEKNEEKTEQKQYETEWTFSFESLGESVAQIMSQLGIGADADLQTTQLTEPIGGATRAKIKLDFTVGRATIGALPADSPNLIEANVTSVGAVEMVATTENGEKSVRLRQKRSKDQDIFKPMKDAVDTVAHNNELEWHVNLSPRVSMSLEIKAGLTLDEFDLSKLNVTRLYIDGGTGKTNVTLPTVATNATIEGGVGILEVQVPDDAKTTLKMDTGAGMTTLTVGNASLKAEIEGGVGNCIITVPHESALRVRADSGLGNIVVPDRAQPVAIESEFISESGIWATAGYEFAPRKIDIVYEGGVGTLSIQDTEEQKSEI